MVYAPQATGRSQRSDRLPRYPARRDLRRDLVLLRDIEIFHDSVFENIRAGRHDIGRVEAREALEQVGLRDSILCTAEGLNSELVSGGAPLSQQQRVQLMLARALAARPRLLLIDGLLDRLDPRSRSPSTRNTVFARCTVDFGDGDTSRRSAEALHTHLRSRNQDLGSSSPYSLTLHGLVCQRRTTHYASPQDPAAQPIQKMPRFSALRMVRSPKSVITLARALWFGFFLGCGALFLAPWQQTAFGVGRVIAYTPEERQQVIEARIKGRITRWYVTEGSTVKKGDLIAEIADNDPQLFERIEEERRAVQSQQKNALSRVEAYKQDQSSRRAPSASPSKPRS